MKTIYLFIIFLTKCSLSITGNIELTVCNAQHTKMPIVLLIPQERNKHIDEIVHIIKKDLLFVDQFEPSIATYNDHATKKELQKKIQKLATLGIPLAILISESSEFVMECHLYDTIQCSSLLSKRYKKKNIHIRNLAHKIADEIRKTLTQNDHLFSSKITYCKKDIQKNTSKIYIADFDGSNEKLIVDSSTIVIAPRWHIKKPELSYSQYTNTTMQLKSTSIEKKGQQEKNISHFENGINMAIDYAPNGEDYVFCASKGDGCCQIYLYQGTTLKQCTNNKGNNDSPVFIDEDHICFCSNFQTGNPQIYIGNIKTGHVQRITKGGYCTSPSYCVKINQIAYHMMIKGTMQIMMYDRTTKMHTQLTFDQGNKHNVSWSPDGAFLLYAHEGANNSSHLETFNLTTKSIKPLSKDEHYHHYPHWSPVYV